MAIAWSRGVAGECACRAQATRSAANHAPGFNRKPRFATWRLARYKSDTFTSAKKGVDWCVTLMGGAEKSKRTYKAGYRRPQMPPLWDEPCWPASVYSHRQVSVNISLLNQQNIILSAQAMIQDLVHARVHAWRALLLVYYMRQRPSDCPSPTHTLVRARIRVRVRVRVRVKSVWVRATSGSGPRSGSGSRQCDPWFKTQHGLAPRIW